MRVRRSASDPQAGIPCGNSRSKFARDLCVSNLKLNVKYTHRATSMMQGLRDNNFLFLAKNKTRRNRLPWTLVV